MPVTTRTADPIGSQQLRATTLLGSLGIVPTRDPQLYTLVLTVGRDLIVLNSWDDPANPTEAVDPSTEGDNGRFAASRSVAELFLEHPIEPPEPLHALTLEETAERPLPDQVRQSIGEEIEALCANYLRRAQAQGAASIVIAENGRFTPSFAADLLDRLPIDPHWSPDVLDRLHGELTRFARAKGGRFGWGELRSEAEGRLEVVSPEPASGPH